MVEALIDAYGAGGSIEEAAATEASNEVSTRYEAGPEPASHRTSPNRKNRPIQTGF